MKVSSFTGVLAVTLIALVSANPVPSTTVEMTVTTTASFTTDVAPTPPVPENDLFIPILPTPLPWPGDAVEPLGAGNVTTSCNATLVGCEEAAAQLGSPSGSIANGLNYCIQLLQKCPPVVPDTLALETRSEDIDCTWCDAYFDGCASIYGLNYTVSTTLEQELAPFYNDIATSQCRLNTCQSSMFSGFCGNYCGYAHEYCSCHSTQCNTVPDLEGNPAPFSPEGLSTLITPLPDNAWRTFSRSSDGTWFIEGTPSFTPPTVTATETITSSVSTGLVTLIITTTWSWPSPEPLATTTPASAPTTTSPLGQPVRHSTTILDPFNVADAAESSWSSSVAASIAAAQVTPN